MVSQAAPSDSRENWGRMFTECKNRDTEHGAQQRVIYLHDGFDSALGRGVGRSVLSFDVGLRHVYGGHVRRVDQQIRASFLSEKMD